MYEGFKEFFKDSIEKERQKVRQESWWEGRREGRREGHQEGSKKEKERVAVDMLKDGKPINEITRYSRLAEGVIRNLAASMGLAVS